MSKYKVYSLEPIPESSNKLIILTELRARMGVLRFGYGNPSYATYNSRVMKRIAKEDGIHVYYGSTDISTYNILEGSITTSTGTYDIKAVNCDVEFLEGITDIKKGASNTAVEFTKIRNGEVVFPSIKVNSLVVSEKEVETILLTVFMMRVPWLSEGEM